MHISNERYFHDRQRHDLALRMIRHEARTCTIRSCTGLTDDRIRRLYKTYASHMPSAPVRRRRGKSPRQVASSSATRGRSSNRRSSRACSRRSACCAQSSQLGTLGPIPADRSSSAGCSATRTKRTASCCATPKSRSSMPGSCCSCLSRNADLRAVRCRHCDSQYLRDRDQHVSSRVPGVRAEANGRGTTLIQSRAWRRRARIRTFSPDRISNAPRTGARTKRVCAPRSPIRQRCSCRSGRRAALVSDFVGRTRCGVFRDAARRRFAGLDASGLHPARRVPRACLFAVELAGEAPPALASGAEFHDLRLIAGELPAEEAGLLAYARAMVHWREHHRFCGRCGSPTDRGCRAGSASCSDTACAHQQFPANRSGRHRAGHGRRARAARPPGGLAAGPVFDHRRIRRARRKPGGRGRARSARGNRRRSSTTSTITPRSRGRSRPR